MIHTVNFSRVFHTEVIATTVIPNENQINLIEACRNGDPKAQFQIYKMYYKAMYNKSLEIVNDPMKVEDIVRESFLIAFERIGAFSGALSFGLWLEMIVHNQSIDSSRQNIKVISSDGKSLPGDDNSIIKSSSPEEGQDRQLTLYDQVK